MVTVMKQPNGSGPQNTHSHGEFGSKISRAGGSRNAESARDAVTQAGGSFGTQRVFDVEDESVSAGSKLPTVTSMLVNGKMINKAKRAQKRKFDACRMRQSRGVRAWRSTSPMVM